MITKEQFLELKKNYGVFSSFAIWESVDNVSDISMFGNDEILKEINNDFIFVALNPADHNKGKKRIVRDFENFHSSYSRQNDYKLCYALQNTKFWGSYITDLFKSFTETNSKALTQKLKSNPLDVEKDIKALEKEIEILTNGKKEITLVALSRDVEGYLKKLFKNKYKIVYATHYAHRHDGCYDKDKYRARVLEQLKEL